MQNIDIQNPWEKKIKYHENERNYYFCSFLISNIHQSSQIFNHVEFGDFGWPLHAKNRKSMNSLFLEMFPFSVKQDDVERFAVAVWLSRRGFWICCYCSRSKPRCYCSRSKPPAASHLWNSYTTSKQKSSSIHFLRDKTFQNISIQFDINTLGQISTFVTVTKYESVQNDFSWQISNTHIC